MTLGCGLGVAVMFSRWCVARIGARNAAFALGVMLTYPFAFYLFGAIYGDALFIAAVLGAFLLLEHDHPILAGLVGARRDRVAPGRRGRGGGSRRARARTGGCARRLAVHARPSDECAVSFRVGRGVCDETSEPAPRIPWFPRRLDLTRLRPSDFGVLLSGLGFVGYVVYLWNRFGEPLAFEKAQGGWDQTPGLHTWFKLELWSWIVHRHSGYTIGRRGRFRD